MRIDEISTPDSRLQGSDGKSIKITHPYHIEVVTEHVREILGSPQATPSSPPGLFSTAKKNLSGILGKFSLSPHKNIPSEVRIEIPTSTGEEISSVSKTPSGEEIFSKNGDNNKSDISDEQLQELITNIVVSYQSGITLSYSSEDEVQKAFFEFLNGQIPHNKKLLFSSEILSTVFWKQKPKVLSSVKELICNILIDIDKQLHFKQLNENQVLHVELIIAELLALYPFLGPKTGEQLHIPLFQGTDLTLNAYEVNIIQLTPSYFGSPIRAVGLKPLDLDKNPKAPPIIINKGTTYFADDGFFLSLLTDLNPFAGVGAYLFWIAYDKYESWLKENTAEGRQAIVIGKSLGGALSMLIATHLPKYVQRVITTGAPGMHSRDVRKWMEISESRPKVDAFFQDNDPIPFIDTIPTEGVNFYKILGERESKGIFSHAMIFSTHKESLIMKLNPEEHLASIERMVSRIFKNPVSLVAFPCLLLVHIFQTLIQETYHLLRYREFKYFRSGDVED